MFEDFSFSSSEFKFQKSHREHSYHDHLAKSQEKLETQHQQYQLFQKFFDSCQNIPIDFIYLKEYFNIPFSDCPNDYEISRLQNKLYSRRFSINYKKSWSLDEKKVLVWVVGKYCQINQKNCRFLDNEDFIEISQYLIRRSVDNVRQKWQSMLKTSLIAQPFTQEEDQQIIILQEKYKSKDKKWKLIANQINNNNLVYRTCKQLRERWINYLDPILLKINEPWTDTEDLELIYQIQQKGKKWTEIAKSMNRNENQVKNRFNCLLKREDVQDDLNKLINKIQWKISKQPVVIKSENQDRLEFSNQKNQSIFLTISHIETLKKEDFIDLTPCMVNLKTTQIYFTPIDKIQGLLKIEQLDFDNQFETAKKDIEYFDAIPNQIFNSLSMISEEYFIPEQYGQIQNIIKSLSELPNFESISMSQTSEINTNTVNHPITCITSKKIKYFKNQTDFSIPQISNKIQWRSLPLILIC
ncbi:unnamed protein product [Paramecium pentaurelia]|uniref:Uncharacterized protein n=1 Tax=Paramecium pentaurelia TaxID=43138 RepID=A0A8S1W1S0_9CILI|nr:unnamed protein product [Paramecium pentaurelia]